MTDREVYDAIMTAGTWLKTLVEDLKIDAEATAININIGDGEGFKKVGLMEAMVRLNEAAQHMKTRSLQ